MDFVYVSALSCPTYSPTMISYVLNKIQTYLTNIQCTPDSLYGIYGQSVGSQSVTKSFVDDINYNWAGRDYNRGWVRTFV
jgi:hypothetical protein